VEGLTEALKLSGLDPALFGFAASLSILLYLLQAFIHWVDTRWTVAVAAVLAGIGAWTKIEQHATPQAIVVNSIGLLTAMLIAQGVLTAMSEKFGFLPKNNQFVPKPPPPSNQ